MKTFRDALEELYEAFSRVPKPKKIAGCPCCADDKHLDLLLAAELRSLTGEQLSPYASSAFLTVGSAADYLYFLPRILEISALDPFWWPDPEVSGHAISKTQPATWPAWRQEALHGFLSAVVARILDSGTFDTLDSWICAIARMGLDVAPYLDQIAETRTAVCSYYVDNARALEQGRLSNAFWELPSLGHHQIVEWFRSPEISAIVLEEYGVELVTPSE